MFSKVASTFFYSLSPTLSLNLMGSLLGCKHQHHLPELDLTSGKKDLDFIACRSYDWGEHIRPCSLCTGLQDVEEMKNNEKAIHQ